MDSTKSPGDEIREIMEQKGWTQRDVAVILGRTLPTVNELIQGKRALTPEMAVAISQAFGHSPEYWLGREATFRVASLAKDQNTDIAKRARIFELAPVKDMQKRGWLSPKDTLVETERELLSFFDIATLSDNPAISASARKTDALNEFNPAQRAWAFRAKQLAKVVRASEFSVVKLNAAVKKLRNLLGWPSEAKKVSSILADCGIRFVVIEPLPHTRIDGIAFWLDKKSPVIAMSMRYDRIDNFWNVLGHEISHIRHEDDPVIDADGVIDARPKEGHTDIERRANEEASATWIATDELQSFIRRVGPLYSVDKINQFANRIRVHPGIIVGQLQHREELRFTAFRESLVKIRNDVTSTTLTDGWGHETGL